MDLVVVSSGTSRVVAWLEYCRLVSGGAFIGCLVGSITPWPEAVTFMTIIGAMACSYFFFPAAIRNGEA